MLEEETEFRKHGVPVKLEATFCYDQVAKSTLTQY